MRAITRNRASIIPVVNEWIPNKWSFDSDDGVYRKQSGHEIQNNDIICILDDLVEDMEGVVIVCIVVRALLSLLQ